MLSLDRRGIDDLRRQFLDEMDNRLQQKLEDWEMNSTFNMNNNKKKP